MPVIRGCLLLTAQLFLLGVCSISHAAPDEEWTAELSIAPWDEAEAASPLLPEEHSSLHASGELPLVPEGQKRSQGSWSTTILPPLDADAVDIRPGQLGAAIQQALEDAIYPSWLNMVADDNLLLWREHRNDWEILPRDSQGMGLTTLNFGSRMELNSEHTGVWLVPRFGWTFVSGPIAPDVRPQLYDLRLEVNFARQFGDYLDLHLQLAPTFATDWDNKSDDAFRLIGGGLVSLHVSEHWSALAGAMYLARHDLSVLPIGGFRWRPADWLEVDAVVPSPRLSLCYSMGEKQSHWLYCGGQLGGGAWAIDHTDGLNDRLAYRDLRFVLGLETRKINGERNVLEAGYVFERKLNFQRFPGDQQLGSTAVIRWGQQF